MPWRWIYVRSVVAVPQAIGEKKEKGKNQPDNEQNLSQILKGTSLRKKSTVPTYAPDLYKHTNDAKNKRLHSRSLACMHASLFREN